MVRVNATIQVDGRPLAWTYVEHRTVGFGTGVYATDEQGRVRDDDFVLGVDSLTPHADIRIYCQNPIVRVLDGKKLNAAVYQDATIRNGDVVDLNTTARQRAHYRVLERNYHAYTATYKWMRFFADQDDPTFPLGRLATLRSTRSRPRRIDLSFPDQFPGVQVSFVEPVRVPGGFPLVHLKTDDGTGPIFGTGNTPPRLVPAELAHALHFTFLSSQRRAAAQAQYMQFILGSPVSGVGPFHDFEVRTTPEVAFIEALDWFGQNFLEFLRRRQGLPTTGLVALEPATTAVQAAFVEEEWARLTRVRRVAELSGAVGTGFTPPSGHPTAPRPVLPRRPTVTGSDVEGAVYGAIFVDFARRVGLDVAASAYFSANALNFGQYRSHINNRLPQHATALEQVRQFWGL